MHTRFLIPLVLVACLDRDARTPSDGARGPAPGDTADSDTDIGGDTAEANLCSPESGDLASAWDGVFWEAYENSSIFDGYTILGSGAICAWTCTEAWAGVEVRARDGSIVLSFPAEFSGGEAGTIYLTATIPSEASGVTVSCTVETSSGTWEAGFSVE
ncbi:MAG: hypothetical protein Q8P18_16220 [Pseudomonadota bacterium]|nr:hypothetical protein [Pseudomonadota bacterium]